MKSLFDITIFAISAYRRPSLQVLRRGAAVQSGHGGGAHCLHGADCTARALTQFTASERSDHVVCCLSRDHVNFSAVLLGRVARSVSCSIPSWCSAVGISSASEGRHSSTVVPLRYNILCLSSKTYTSKSPSTLKKNFYHLIQPCTFFNKTD